MGIFGPPNVEKMKAKGNIKGLVKALGYQKSPDVCQSASRALVEIGAAAVEPLIAAFRNDAARQSAIETLVKIGEPSIGPLIEALGRYRERESAVKALRQIGEPALELAVERYAASLVPAEAEVLGDQIDALVAIGAPAVERLVVILAQRRAAQVRQYVAGALGKIGDRRAVDALILALQDEDSSVRGAAAGALFLIGDDRAIEPLIANLRDEDLVVKFLGSAVWGLIGSGQTVKQLLTDLAAAESHARVDAIRHLKELGWKQQ